MSLPPTLLLLPLHPISLPLSLLLSSSSFSVSSFYSSPLSSFQLLSLLLLSFAFSILIFLALVSTIYHTLLDTSSFSLPLFSNQSQDCGKLAMASPKSLSISAHQSCLSLFSPCVLDNKYLPPPYFL